MTRTLAIVLLLLPMASPNGGVRFRPHALAVDLNEGCAVADVDRDGTMDLIAGRSWYAAPDFVARPVRDIAEWNGYYESNGEHAYDVNGDGWVDVVSGTFLPSKVMWFENPGAEGLAEGRLWTPHLLADTETSQNEISFLRDLDGDGTPEWVVNSWSTEADLLAWRLAKDAEGAPTLKKAVLGVGAHGHGMGFGDLDGDGREDILVGTGWYERPAGAPLDQPWTHHPDWDWHASCPMIVTDLNGDGRNDIIRGQGHDYGLFWMEQLEPGEGGALRWKEHLIDREWSQPHALYWADIDGDGAPELITGKRVRAHNGKDPGGTEPAVFFYYDWDLDARRFERHVIDRGTVGTGLQIRAADFDDDGRLDIAVSGKSGTYVLMNEGH